MRTELIGPTPGTHTLADGADGSWLTTTGTELLAWRLAR
jgi:hypothetical protein